MSYRGIANMPGVDGSLGMCALCGDGFMFEILMGKNVCTVSIEGMDKDVCLHQKCLAVLEKNGPDWRTLPDGPLRKAYEKASNATEPTGGNQGSLEPAKATSASAAK